MKLITFIHYTTHTYIYTVHTYTTPAHLTLVTYTNAPYPNYYGPVRMQLTHSSPHDNNNSNNNLCAYYTL